MFAERFPSSALAWTLKTRPPPDHYCLQLVLTLLHASQKRSASHGFPGDLTQALGSTRKPQTLNWFWSQDSSYSNGPTSNSEQTTLRISSSKFFFWKNKHATITSVLPLLLISTSDALFFIKYFEASDFTKLLSYLCFVEDVPAAGEVAAMVGSWTKNPLVGMEGKPRG